MSKWIAEFELEDGDKMPEHMDLEYHGVKLDFHCRPLEQKPCEDAVSRKSAITIIQNHWWNCRDIDKLVNELPPVTPQEPRWIPVTEDAPPKGTICLWCNKEGSVFTSEITYRSECSSYVGKHGYFSNGLENHGNIVAWMPLPEPYKERRTE